MSRMLRINILATSNRFSGPNRLITEYANRLAELGYEPTIYYPLLPYLTFQLSFNVSWYMHIRHMLSWIRYSIRQIGEHKLRWRYHSIISSKVKVKPFLCLPSNSNILDGEYLLFITWFQALEVQKLSPSKGQRIFFVMHYEGGIDNIVEEKVRSSYFLAYRHIAISEATKRFFEDEMNIKIDRVIPLGVDTQRFSPGQRAHSLPPRLLLYYGSELRKGAKLGLEALEIVKGKHPDVKVSLLMQGGKMTIPDNYVAYYNLSEAELIEVYCQHDIFVFPSRFEGFGLPPLEAMACGCAVVTTAVGAIPEYAKHEENALICSPGDPEELAACIIRLIDDQKLCSRLYENGIITACQQSWERSTQILDDYLQVMKDDLMET